MIYTKRKEDIYDLINSKAIGDYCREIRHKFNTMELAVLVYRNKKIDIFEKISKYQDFIGEKDCIFVLDHISDYDSFEYFEGEIEENNRILKLISSFLKGKIDNLELFIKAYESFKSDYEGKMPNIFIDEDLKLAGFSDWDISRIHNEFKKLRRSFYI